MLVIRQEQIDAMARAIFIRRLYAAFTRDIPSFAVCEPDERSAFISQALSLAETKGFKTEQGFASYALALWWLGVDFEEKSQELEALLKSNYPETRKAYAMNEWVQVLIGDPDNVAAADEALRQGLSRSEAWGPPQ
jgi:hypothetical protein